MEKHDKRMERKMELKASNKIRDGCRAIISAECLNKTAEDFTRRFIDKNLKIPNTKNSNGPKYKYHGDELMNKEHPSKIAPEIEEIKEK